MKNPICFYCGKIIPFFFQGTITISKARQPLEREIYIVDEVICEVCVGKVKKFLLKLKKEGERQ